MPEAGLSVPRGQARRTRPRHDGDPREAPPAARYTGPRPVRAGSPAPQRGYDDDVRFDPRRAAADRATRARDAVASGRISDAHADAVSRRSAIDRPTSRRAPADRPATRRASADRPAPATRRASADRLTPAARPASADRPAPGNGIPGRRTVTIQGRGAERYTPKRRPVRRAHERAGFKPDRTAMWAVLLGFLLVLVAATSSHAAVLPPHALSALHALAISR
jgi:hypothetical protein